MNIREKREAGFTLLELLIVVSIIAILSVALVLVLNPAEALKKSRDAQRMSDLSTIKTALGLMLTSTSSPSLDNTFGSTAATSICTTTTGGASATTPKIRYSLTGVTGGTGGTSGTDSVLATWATGNMGGSFANAGDVAGTGWIPAVLSNLTGGSPISNYPVDPTNTIGALGGPVTADLVYRFACQNGGASGKPGYVFEVDATLESDAYTTADPKKSTDGGDNINMYEVGTSLKLLPVTAGVF